MDKCLAAALDKLVAAGIVAVLVLAPTQFSFEVREHTHLSIVDPILWLTALVWGIKVLRDKTFSRITFPPVLAWLFVVQAALSLLTSEDRIGSAKEIIQTAEYFLVAIALFSTTMQAPGPRGRLTLVFLVTATVVIALGAVQYLQPSSVPAFGVGATLSNRNVLGGFLALVLPLFYALLLFDTSFLRRIWYALVTASGLMIMLSGGAMLGVLLALAVVSALKSGKVLIAYLCAVLLAGGLVLPHLPREQGDILTDSVALYSGGEPTTRYPEWQAALTMAQANPWLGVGTGTYQAHIGRYYGTVPSPAVKAESDSQNLYLVLASSMGWPGLAWFVGLLLVCGSRAMRSFFTTGDPRRTGLAAGLVGSLIAFGVAAVWAPLLVRGIGLPLAVALSLCLTLDTRAHAAQDEK